ncbi:MAG TPA: hypothetical protein VHB45_11035 [Alloacidobacterium sp.]|nr:hypothetical protein [Alloacidobacterium sp.]
MKRCFGLLVLLSIVVVTACRVQVDKNKNGDDKNVKIDTPMGGLHVRTDQMTAADVGLPVYPGAQIISSQNDKSADIHMGFGKWQLRIKVINYQTGDSQDQVLAFYRKALGRYGDVIQCSGDSAVGTPTTTSEGLTCSNGNTQHANINDTEDGLNLRAGSRHHQHIVGFKSSNSGSKFTLVELELPESDGNSQESQ